MDEDAAEYLTRMAALSRDDEAELLNRILTGGYDQGRFLRPNDSDLIPNTPAVTQAVLDAVGGREEAEATAADPYQNERPPVSAVPGEDPGYVVLTQGCDLIRGLEAEPFVELARVELADDANFINSAKRNSPRYIYLADGAEGCSWVVDLRHQGRLAKDKLPDYALLQPLAGGHIFKRFKMRVGNRYSRDALLTDLVERLQRPFRDFLRTKPALMRKAGVFTDFLVFQVENEQVRIDAVIEAGADKQQAEDDWQEIEDALPPAIRDVIHEDSGAIPTEQVNWWRYTTGWKTDLDDVSYSRRAGRQAPPTI